MDHLFALLCSIGTLLISLPAIGQSTIQLSELKNATIDLKGQNGTVFLVGTWKGDRLIIKNAQNIQLIAKGKVKIISTHQEDALILENPRKVSIKGNKKLSINQSITVWGSAEQLTLDGIIINGAHTGIRINQNVAYQQLTIQHCRITNCDFEGIYIGPHYKSAKQLSNVFIRRNQISQCGWDGIQVGNCAQFEITGNKVSRCGLKQEWGQDFDLTINPGSQGKLSNNKIKGKIQVLDSRVFFE